MSLSGHQSAAMKSAMWVTPPEILAPLGSFDLDPCSFYGHPWPIAPIYFTEDNDGLSHDWAGRAWVNPPFGSQAIKWLAKLANHRNGIALIPARTETRMFFDWVWSEADAICFLQGRPHFHYADGTRAPFNSGAPICLVAYGRENATVLENCGLGKTITLNEPAAQPPQN
jgi:hypothetical protein